MFDFFFFFSTGPDAVKYIVNHALVQVIFCVPQTLNAVSERLDFSQSAALLEFDFNIQKKSVRRASFSKFQILASATSLIFD